MTFTYTQIVLAVFFLVSASLSYSNINKKNIEKQEVSDSFPAIMRDVNRDLNVMVFQLNGGLERDRATEMSRYQLIVKNKELERKVLVLEQEITRLIELSISSNR